LFGYKHEIKWFDDLSAAKKTYIHTYTTPHAHTYPHTTHNYASV